MSARGNVRSYDPSNVDRAQGERNRQQGTSCPDGSWKLSIEQRFSEIEDSMANISQLLKRSLSDRATLPKSDPPELVGAAHPCHAPGVGGVGRHGFRGGATGIYQYQPCAESSAAAQVELASSVPAQATSNRPPTETHPLIPPTPSMIPCVASERPQASVPCQPSTYSVHAAPCRDLSSKAAFSADSRALGPVQHVVHAQLATEAQSNVRSHTDARGHWSCKTTAPTNKGVDMQQVLGTKVVVTVYAGQQMNWFIFFLVNHDYRNRCIL